MSPPADAPDLLADINVAALLEAPRDLAVAGENKLADVLSRHSRCPASTPRPILRRRGDISDFYEKKLADVLSHHLRMC